MAMTDLENIEIAQGPHYHAWALLPHLTTVMGRKYSFLAYSASMLPHLSRSTAQRHAKQMSAGDYGSGGYMALKCTGGDGCPLLYYMGTPFAAQEEANAIDAFTESGAKAILTPHHAAKEGEK